MPTAGTYVCQHATRLKARPSPDRESHGHRRIVYMVPSCPQECWIPSGPPARFTDEMKGVRVARPPGDSLGYYRRAAGKEFTGFAGGAGQNRTFAGRGGWPGCETEEG